MMRQELKRTKAMSGLLSLAWRTLVLLFLVFGLCCEGRRHRENLRSSNAIGCNSNPLKFEDEPCDTDTNCRYGGKCRQVTNFKTHDATLRLIVPSHAKPLDLPLLGSQRRSHDRRTSVPENPFLQAGQPTECVCALDCRREPSHTGTVCGSNDKTYESECDLREEACRCQTEILVKRRGPCREGVPSVDLLDTFADDESLSASGEQSEESSGDQMGSCDTLCSFGAVCDPDSEDEPCKCIIECKAQSITYVCGTDGRTYTSECQMKQAQCRHQIRIDTLHAGPCTSEERRSLRSRHQRMRSDGGSRATGYSRRHSHLEAAIDSTTEPCQTLNCNGAVDDPLCGTDAISYPNECVMRVASCVKDSPIEVKYKGFCQEHFEVPTTNDPSLVPMRRDAVFEGDIPESNDPCREIYCLHNAVCIEHEEYEFMCSCEDICHREVPDASTETGSDDKSLRLLSAFLPNPSVFKGDIGVPDMSPLVNTLHKRKVKADRESAGLREPDRSHEVMVIDFTGDPDIEEAWDNEVTVLPKHRKGRRKGRRRRRNGRSRHSRERGDYRVRRSLSKRDLTSARPFIEETVCGTDGKTYGNECQMRKEACHKKAWISVAHRGACPMKVKSKPDKAASKSTPAFMPTLSLTTTPTTTAAGTDDIQQRDENVRIDELSGLLGDEMTGFLDENQNRKEDDSYVDTSTTGEPLKGGISKETERSGRKGKKRRKGKGRKRQRESHKKDESEGIATVTDEVRHIQPERLDNFNHDEDETLSPSASSGGVENNAKPFTSSGFMKDPFSAEMSKGVLEVGDNDILNSDPKSEIIYSTPRTEEVRKENVEDTPIGNKAPNAQRQFGAGDSKKRSNRQGIKRQKSSTGEVYDVENEFPDSVLETRDESEPEAKFDSFWEGFHANSIPGLPGANNIGNERNETINNFTEGGDQSYADPDLIGGSTSANPLQRLPYTPSTWGIALGVIASLVVVIGVWVYFWRRRKGKESSNPAETTPAEPVPDGPSPPT